MRLRAGDLDDVQRFIKASGMLPPLRGSKAGEDWASRSGCDSSDLGVPGVDDCRHSDGLIGIAQRGDRDILQLLQSAQRIAAGAGIPRSGSGQGRCGSHS